MEKESLKYQRLREEMVRQQIEARGVSDPAVLTAMRRVPRHMFVSEALRDQAYGDFPLPIGEQQTISQPYIVAEMTQALELTPEDRVLEIGTGSGYQAAILAQLAYRVFTIERMRSLYLQARRLFDELRLFNIVTRYGDGSKGWEEESPYNAIIVTAGAPMVPAILLNQLAVGGRLIAPVGNPHSQELIKLVKEKGGVREVNLGGCRFVKLIGEHGWKEGGN
jgi:protein-L-isoaspartate(D-aspartate) O-methyltransferase